MDNDGDGFVEDNCGTVQKKAAIRKFNNIETILTDYNTHSPKGSIDLVFLFYVLHDFKNPAMIMTELGRVLYAIDISIISFRESRIFQIRINFNNFIIYICIYHYGEPQITWKASGIRNC
jgi:hypothetical protein